MRGFWISFAYRSRPTQRDSLLRASVQKASKEFIDTFSIYVEAEPMSLYLGRPRLVVANHLSYIDVVVLLSLDRFAFLTSKEVYDHWLLGKFIRFAGSSYVDRRKAISLRTEFSRLAKMIQETPIVIFPEATTSNGERVLPFKRALLDWARKEEIPVHCLCLNYKEWNRQRICRSTADRIFYYGEMGFFSHLFGFIKTKSLKVEVISRKELVVGGEEIDSQEWINEIQTWISDKYLSRSQWISGSSSEKFALPPN